MKACIIRCLIVLTATSTCAFAQQTAEDPKSEEQLAQVLKQLQEQIVSLQNSVAELRSESERYRAETRELERRLDAMPQQANATQAEQPAPKAEPGTMEGKGSQPNSADTRVSRLDDEYALLAAKVDDQYQTKVESGSKYRVRLSGLVMLNLFSNRGLPDSIDSPSIALPIGSPYAAGSFAGTLRQSQVGVEVFGPEWAGAKVSGDLRFDFAGGFPAADDGVTFGLMRLRTGNVRLNWAHTSLIAGQDSPMFSPLFPTSVIALAQPDFAYSGNLWNWVPQFQVQHWKDLGLSQRLTLAAGILDPLTGETPTSQFLRTPQAGEASRQPGYSARIGWSDLSNEDRPRTFSVGGYFSRENWGFNRDVNGWAVTADGETPLAGRFSLKGEFYRGSAIGGFGASNGQSVVSTDVLQNRFAVVRGLNTIGGWAQAGYRASPTLQFNAGYGLDNPFSDQLRHLTAAQYSIYSGIGVNRSAMANVIYRPRSDLLFSVEYRRLMASHTLTPGASADNIGMGIGLVF
jgi:hypothetical protein